MANNITDRTITGPLTIDAWLAAYKNERPLEVVDGKPLVSTPWNLGDATIGHDLYDALDGFVRTRQLGRVWMRAAYVFEVNEQTGYIGDARTADVSFVDEERMRLQLEEYDYRGPLRMVPNLVVEIVSLYDSYSYIVQKVADYLRYGVRMVWLIDPQTRTFRVYTPDDPEGKTLHDGDVLSGAPVLPGWSLPVTDVLGES